MRSRRGAPEPPDPARPSQPVHVAVIQPVGDDESIELEDPSSPAGPTDHVETNEIGEPPTGPPELAGRPDDWRVAAPSDEALGATAEDPDLSALDELIEEDETTFVGPIPPWPPELGELPGEWWVAAPIAESAGGIVLEPPAAISGHSDTFAALDPTGTAAVEPPVGAKAAPGGTPLEGQPAGPGLPTASLAVEGITATPVAPALEPSTTRRRFQRNQKRAQHRRSHPRRRMVLAVLAAVVLLLGAGGAIVAVRLHVRAPVAVVRSTLSKSRLVPGPVPVIPWPAGVQSAIAIPALGVTEVSGPPIEAPIASVTKLMTAHVVLADHPLSAGEEGPSITITANDVALYQDDVSSDQANIEVAVGEVLSEHQLLEGMLVHSASNFADLLAVWDAGSISAFVSKMNAAALALGMSHTQYADASGYAPQSVSTPADQLKVAEQDVANPVFDQIVDMPSVSLPVSGTVGSYTPLIGIDGVVGVKSGFTSVAGGCDVLALQQDVNGVPVEVLAVVIGNHVGTDVITGAGLQALSIARPAMAAIKDITLVSRGEHVGFASASGHRVPVVPRATVSVLAWPGQPISESFNIVRQPRAGAAEGFVVGLIHIQVGPHKFQVAAQTAGLLPSPSFFQRVF